VGVVVTGLNEFIGMLGTYPARADKAFRQVSSRAGMNIKEDWLRRWQTMPHAHIPHLVRSVGYDLSARNFAYTVEVGVARTNRQAFLAEIIAYGTATSGPHDAGLQRGQAEAPRAEKAAVDVLEQLLTGAL
jgi:hypothetical protein